MVVVGDNNDFLFCDIFCFVKISYFVEFKLAVNIKDDEGTKLKGLWESKIILIDQDNLYNG